MPTVPLAGINTRYELIGNGPPLLMFSPGGFDATIEKWSSLGIYAKTQPLAFLSQHFQCIVFDRRECGQSGGRVEPITWLHYVAQAKALLDHLDLQAAHLMGGCMGCAPVAAFAVAHPQATLSMLLFWPVGGAKYRINGQARFAQHLAFVQEHSLAEVAALAQSSGKSFGEDPRGGPWAAVLRSDPNFAANYSTLDKPSYIATVQQMQQNLFDRDTAPGAEPEALLKLNIPALVVPGRDAAHATSAARYLEECLPGAQYWDMPVDGQTAAATSTRLLEFLLNKNTES
jgi:pimeloyl-ACP methyl ester carboxylesterase